MTATNHFPTLLSIENLNITYHAATLLFNLDLIATLRRTCRGNRRAKIFALFDLNVMYLFEACSSLERI